MTQGCLLRVQKWTVGRSHEVSSKVPAFTLRTDESFGPEQTRKPHFGQVREVCAYPFLETR
jgi:hypothetical protein